MASKGRDNNWRMNRMRPAAGFMKDRRNILSDEDLIEEQLEAVEESEDSGDDSEGGRYFERFVQAYLADKWENEEHNKEEG